MRTAAVSKLKASLSEYLSKVKAGEEVLVTDRGKAIAKLIPVHRDETEVPAHLLTLEKAGLVRIGSGKIKANFWDLPRPKDKKGLALRALIEERAEER
jgi:prevent-host-death family protein